jgi:hypothetical protein
MSSNRGDKGLSRRAVGGSSSSQAAAAFPLSSQQEYSNEKNTSLCCLSCYNYRNEILDYDFSNLDKQQPPVRHLPLKNEYYIDTFNDQPWSWTFGTHESVRMKVRVRRVEQTEPSVLWARKAADEHSFPGLLIIPSFIHR